MGGSRRRIVWTDSADLDLGRAIEGLNQRNPQAAREFVRTVLRTVASLRDFPQIGAIAIEQSRERQYRNLVCGQHRIFYRIENAAIVIVRVWDTRRNPEDLKVE